MSEKPRNALDANNISILIKQSLLFLFDKQCVSNRKSRTENLFSQSMWEYIRLKMVASFVINTEANKLIPSRSTYNGARIFNRFKFSLFIYFFFKIVRKFYPNNV